MYPFWGTFFPSTLSPEGTGRYEPWPWKLTQWSKPGCGWSPLLPMCHLPMKAVL